LENEVNTMERKRVAVLLTDKFEDSEASSPIEAMRAQGMEIVVVGPEAGKTYQGKKEEFTVTSDVAVAGTSADEYDALLLPGGAAPEALREEKGAVEFVRGFVDADKPIAAICHGPQLLISADALRGRRMTCVSSIAVDMKNAGAKYVDRSVVVDGNLVTSRTPEDLPDFNREMIRLFSGTPAEAGRR
jgi:protease I